MCRRARVDAVDLDGLDGGRWTLMEKFGTKGSVAEKNPAERREVKWCRAVR